MKYFRALWFRYLFFKALLHLVIFFAVISIIFFTTELATQFHYLHDTSLTPSMLFEYYLGCIAERPSFLVVSATLFALFRLLYTLNIHHEITTLLTSGLSFRKILSPVFIAVLFSSLTIFYAEEKIRPHVLSIRAFRVKKSQSSDQSPYILKSHLLPDGGHFIYMEERTSHKLKDLFWIHPSKEVWHATSLTCIDGVCMAYQTTHISSLESSHPEPVFSTSHEPWPIPPSIFQPPPKKGSLQLSPIESIIFLSDPLVNWKEIQSRKVMIGLLFDLTHLLFPIWLFCIAVPYFATYRRQHALIKHMSFTFMIFISTWMILASIQIAAEAGLISPWFTFLIGPVTLSIASSAYFFKKTSRLG